MSDWPTPGITEIDAPEPEDEPGVMDDAEPEDEDQDDG